MTAEAFYYFAFGCVVILTLVTFAALTQWAQARFPALGRFLDRHTPEQGDRPW